MAKRNSKTEFRDLEAALVCGEAFYRLAERFIDSIPAVDASTKRPTDQIGDVVACATNLSLAAEVFLKALLGACDVPVPQTHDLRSLHAALPLHVQADVQERYTIEARSLRLPARASITFAKGPIDEPPWDDSHKDPTSIEKVFTRSKDLFISFRYIYEFTDPTRYQYRTFEYRLLQLACLAVRSAVKSHLEAVDGSA